MINLQKELGNIQKVNQTSTDQEFRSFLTDYLNTMVSNHEESLSEALNMLRQNLCSTLKNHKVTDTEVCHFGHHTKFYEAMGPIQQLKEKPFRLPMAVLDKRVSFPERSDATYSRIEDGLNRMKLGDRIVKNYTELCPEIISGYKEKRISIYDKASKDLNKLGVDLTVSYHKHREIKRRLLGMSSDREVSLQTLGYSVDDLEVFYGFKDSREANQVAESSQIGRAEQVGEAAQAASETIKSKDADLSPTHSISEPCETGDLSSLVDPSTPIPSHVPNDFNSARIFKPLLQIKGFSQIKETDTPQIVGMVRGVNSHHFWKDYKSQSKDHASILKNVFTSIGQYLRDHTYNENTASGFVRAVNEKKMSEAWQEKHCNRTAPPPPFACIRIYAPPLIFEPKSCNRPMTSSFLGIFLLITGISGVLVWRWKSNDSNSDANSKKDEL